MPELLDDESDGVDATSDETDPLTLVLIAVPTFAELLSGHCDLLTLCRLTLVSRGFHEGVQVVLEDRWLESLMEMDGSGEDPVLAWAEISNDIIIAKDENGSVFIPGLLNLIGELQPGQGYQIKLSTGATWNYPAND